MINASTLTSNWNKAPVRKARNSRAINGNMATPVAYTGRQLRGGWKSQQLTFGHVRASDISDMHVANDIPEKSLDYLVCSVENPAASCAAEPTSVADATDCTKNLAELQAGFRPIAVFLIRSRKSNTNTEKPNCLTNFELQKIFCQVRNGQDSL